MKATIRQLVSSNSTLQKLCLIPAGDSLTLVQVYKIGKIAKAVDVEVRSFEEKKNELIARYGEVADENGQQVKVKDEHLTDFIRQIEEMFDLEVDIPGDTFSVSDLPDSIGLTAVDLVNLAWLITGD